MARQTSTQAVQYGREATPGTPVPANRSLSSLGVMLSPQVESSAFRPKGFKYPTVVAANKEWAGGDLEGTPTYDEIIVPLAGILSEPVTSEIMDGATPTGAYRHVFSPASQGADTPAIFTFEEGDADNAERMAHGLVTDFNLDISRSEVGMGGTVIGQRLETGIAKTADPTPLAEDLVPILPGQVCIYVADTQAGLESAPGVSDPAMRQGTVLSVEPSIGGRFEPVWYLNCVLDSFGTYVEAPEPDFTVDYTVEANEAGLAWLENFRVGKTQFVRIEATGPRIYEGAENVDYLLRWDFAVKTLEPGEKSDEDGVYAIQPSLQVVHDPAWGKATEVTVINTVQALEPSGSGERRRKEATPMAMKLSQVQAVEKTVTVQFMDNDVEVAYRPARMTPQVLENVMEAAKATGEDEAGAMSVIGSMLEPVLAWWDVLDDDDQRLPTDAATIKTMPLAFLMEVMGKVQEDQRPPGIKGLRRWLTTDGQMGESPTWYRVLKAAQFLRVAPWDLAAQPLYWVEVAEGAQAAEAHAEKMNSKSRKGQQT